MPNFVQKFIYNISSIVPLCFAFSIVWFLEKSTIYVPLIFIGCGLFISLLFVLSFSYGRKNIAPISIRVTDISPHDGWIAIYIITYLLPFASIAIEEVNIIICTLIAALLVVVAPYINTAIPNPILFLKGYHFYQISAENGLSGYVLISKRKLRKSADLKNVKRIFEFLLLDSLEG